MYFYIVVVSLQPADVSVNLTLYLTASSSPWELVTSLVRTKSDLLPTRMTALLSSMLV